MKKILLIFFTIFSLNSIAQNNSKIIKGTVFIDSIPVQDVHIINKKLNIGTISDEKGKFEIIASKGDILIISHLNFEYKEHPISYNDILLTKINIHLNSKNYMLDEVVIEKRKGIFDIDKDISPHNAPIVNAKTLKLPYANSKKVEKEKTVNIKSGVSISAIGLINAINGKTKLKNQLKKIQTADKNLDKIRKHFTDGFFIQQLKIKEEHINSFLEYCLSKGIVNLYKKDKVLELTSILIDNSKNSTYSITKNDTRITQK